MAIPINDRLNYPLDDENMYYDFTKHHYILRHDAVLRLAYIDMVELFGGEDNAQAHCNLLSTVIFDSIMRFRRVENVEKATYYLAHSKEARESFLRLLLDSQWFNRTDGGFMVVYNTGINLNEMKEIPMDIKRSMSVIADQIVKNSRLADRVVRYNLDDMYYFETLDELKAYMVDNNYIKQEKADKVEKLSDIPNNYKYLVWENEDNEFVFQDRLTWRRLLSKKGVEW